MKKQAYILYGSDHFQVVVICHHNIEYVRSRFPQPLSNAEIFRKLHDEYVVYRGNHAARKSKSQKPQDFHCLSFQDWLCNNYHFSKPESTELYSVKS